MAIQPLESRLNDMIPDKDVGVPVESAPPLLAEETPVDESVQVAGLATSGLGNIFKVIKQGVKTVDQLAPNAAEKASGEAARKIVTDSAIKVQKESVPGVVQKIDKAISTKPAVVKPQEPQPLPLATTEEMQAAIKSVDEAVEQGPKLADENVPGVFIVPADEAQTIKFCLVPIRHLLALTLTLITSKTREISTR